MLLAMTAFLMILLTAIAIWRLNQNLVDSKDDQVVMAELLSESERED
jgi:hypothetical protein